MSKIKDLKKEHKKLEIITKKATKKRLNDRASDSWMNLRLMAANSLKDELSGIYRKNH